MRELETDEPDYLCKPEYLVRKVSLIEAEQENRITDPLGLTPNLPFGHLNAAWGKFLAEFGLEAENELWFFEVPKGSSTGEYDMFDGPISGYAKVVNGNLLQGEGATRIVTMNPLIISTACMHICLLAWVMKK